MRIVVGEVAHLVDVDVATVAVVEVDEDVLGVEVWSGDSAGVEVAQLQPDTYRHISYRMQVTLLSFMSRRHYIKCINTGIHD